MTTRKPRRSREPVDATEALLARLRDLLKQATTEQSHFYVAKCCRDAIAEIERLRAQLAAVTEIVKAARPFASHVLSWGTLGDGPKALRDALAKFDAARATKESKNGE